MSEFKFACPVCGQHITVASNSSGQQMDCPTCFRRIVVPQAPASGDSKLLLAGAQPAQPRPAPLAVDLEPLGRRRSRTSLLETALLLVLLGASAALIYFYRAPLLRAVGLAKKPVPQAHTKEGATNAAPVAAIWTLDPSKAVVPERMVSGRLHGREFVCEKALFSGGILSLRQGAAWPPDLGLDILLSAQKAEQLNGKSIVIAPGARSVVAKIVLRWKDEQNQAQSRDFTTGYALNLFVGPANGQRLSAKVYVALPDRQESFAAGTFEAEVVQPRTNAK